MHVAKKISLSRNKSPDVIVLKGPGATVQDYLKTYGIKEKDLKKLAEQYGRTYKSRRYVRLRAA